MRRLRGATSLGPMRSSTTPESHVQKQRSLGKRSRRPRHEAPKVWHNPDVVTTPAGRGSPAGAASGASASRGHVTRRSAEGARGHADGHAGGVGAPRSGDAASLEHAKTERAPGRSQRIVAVATGPRDPVALERERLIARLCAAEGRPAITRAADAVLEAGHELPADDQSVQLQLLEHSKEEHVEAALGRLAIILAVEPCKRPTVLESRLRRLEQFADEPSTREAARRLFRQVTGRAADPARGAPSGPHDAPATLRSESVASDAPDSD